MRSDARLKRERPMPKTSRNWSRPSASLRRRRVDVMLPEDWSRTSVGDACAIKNNLRFPINTEQRASMPGPYPYLGPTGVLAYIDHYRIDEEFAVIGEDGDHFLKFRDKPMTLFFQGKVSGATS